MHASFYENEISYNYCTPSNLRESLPLVTWVFFFSMYRHKNLKFAIISIIALFRKIKK